jgi:hypothetical protein
MKPRLNLDKQTSVYYISCSERPEQRRCFIASALYVLLWDMPLGRFKKCEE